MSDPAGLSQFKTADGLTLPIADEGAGPPLLCLPGLTRNMDDFEPVMNFADRARIIRLDSRGRGRSEFDPNWRNYTIPQEAMDALALLDHLKINRAAILGTSRGGLIAMTLAVTARNRLAGTVLHDIGPALDLAGLDFIMGYIGRPPGLTDFEAAVDALPDRMAPRFANVDRATWRAYARRIWRETPQGLALRYDPKLRDAVEEGFKTASEVDLWPLFRALDGSPLGLIRGANSDLLSADTAARMQAEIPSMLQTTVPDRGHVPFLNEPQSQALIAEFLDQLT